jgi:hypothetical protein
MPKTLPVRLLFVLIFLLDLLTRWFCSEFGIAPKQVVATETFEATKRAAQVAPGGVLAGAVLDELVLPQDETVGFRFDEV